MNLRDAYLPVDRTHGARGRHRDDLVGPKPECLKTIDRVTALVRNNIIDAQANAKRRFDAQHKEKPLRFGSLVKLRVNARKPGGKLMAKWTGPYRLIKQHVNSKNVYVIETARGRTKTVNKIHLAPWFSRLTPE